MSREIGAYEAKTHLPQLLRDVARGDRITITVRGHAVAELVPARRSRESAACAIEAMKAFEPARGIAAEDIAAWISEGRT